MSLLEGGNARQSLGQYDLLEYPSACTGKPFVRMGLFFREMLQSSCTPYNEDTYIESFQKLLALGFCTGMISMSDVHEQRIWG